MIRVAGVAKVFSGGTVALDNLSFTIASGEFVTLLGPSGCGKSTALRLIANLTQPDSGNITFDGPTPAMGFVFQEPTLMPWARVIENVRLPLDLQGVPHAEGNARAAQALARLGLSGFEQSYPRELSGGMKMRVSLARALVARPRLLLLDEPFAALDETARFALNDDLIALAKQDAITVIFVTHSLAEAAYLSDRVLVMTPRPGRVAADIALVQPAQRNAAWRVTPGFAALQAQIALSQGGAQ